MKTDTFATSSSRDRTNCDRFTKCRCFFTLLIILLAKWWPKAKTSWNLQFQYHYGPIIFQNMPHFIWQIESMRSCLSLNWFYLPCTAIICFIFFKWDCILIGYFQLKMECMSFNYPWQSGTFECVFWRVFFTFEKNICSTKIHR